MKKVGLLCIALFLSTFLKNSESSVLLNPLVFMETEKPVVERNPENSELENQNGDRESEYNGRRVNCWVKQKMALLEYYCQMLRELQLRQKIMSNHG